MDHSGERCNCDIAFLYKHGTKIQNIMCMKAGKEGDYILTKKKKKKKKKKHHHVFYIESIASLNLCTMNPPGKVYW
jgi:hypothetical protein